MSCEHIHPKPPNFGGSRVGLDALDLTYDTNRFRSNKSYLINIKNHPCLICPLRRSGEYIHPKPPNFGGSRVGLDALDLTYDTNRLRSNKSYLVNIKNHPWLICPFRGSCEHIHDLRGRMSAFVEISAVEICSYCASIYVQLGRHTSSLGRCWCYKKSGDSVVYECRSPSL